MECKWVNTKNIFDCLREGWREVVTSDGAMIPDTHRPDGTLYYLMQKLDCGVWSMHNGSSEALEMVQSVDTSVKGCRVLDTGDIVMPFGPDETICVATYEPGNSFVVRPVVDPDKPRRFS